MSALMKVNLAARSAAADRPRQPSASLFRLQFRPVKACLGGKDLPRDAVRCRAIFY
jgi:hypothetical protein